MERHSITKRLCLLPGALLHCASIKVAVCTCTGTMACTCCVQLVGPILAEPAKPLSDELDSFVQQGTAKGLGAVYVSMGSSARLSEEAVYSMAQGLSALPHPVVWKLSRQELPGPDVLAVVTTCLNLKSSVSNHHGLSWLGLKCLASANVCHGPS